MPWVEYRSEVSRRVIILPVGSLEHHGPSSTFPPPGGIVPNSGVLNKATYASRETGEKLAQQVEGAIVRIARQELGS